MDSASYFWYAVEYTTDMQWLLIKLTRCSDADAQCCPNFAHPSPTVGWRAQRIHEATEATGQTFRSYWWHSRYPDRLCIQCCFLTMPLHWCVVLMLLVVMLSDCSTQRECAHMMNANGMKFLGSLTCAGGEPAGR